MMKIFWNNKFITVFEYTCTYTLLDLNFEFKILETKPAKSLTKKCDGKRYEKCVLFICSIWQKDRIQLLGRYFMEKYCSLKALCIMQGRSE